MEKILIIIPYFGKMPNWFQTFLNSSGRTELIDFLFLTDDRTEFDYPSNFKVVYMDFKEVQDLFRKKLGPIHLTHGYKFCDYKPTYGYVLNEYTEGYAFWGHSDIDIVWGDLDQFLRKANYTEFDRIFGMGHLSIYRNNDRMNTSFRTKLRRPYPKIFQFDFVKNTSYISLFDEIGMNFIMKEGGFRFYDEVHSHNVNMNYSNYAIGDGQPKVPELLLYDDGHLYVVRKGADGLVKEEFMYLHIQKRKITKNLVPKTDRFLLTVDGFIDVADESNLEPYFDQYGMNPDDEKQRNYQANLKQWLKDTRTAKLKREMKSFPFQWPYNLWVRKKGADWIGKFHYR